MYAMRFKYFQFELQKIFGTDLSFMFVASPHPNTPEHISRLKFLFSFHRCIEILPKALPLISFAFLVLQWKNFQSLHISHYFYLLYFERCFQSVEPEVTRFLFFPFNTSYIFLCHLEFCIILFPIMFMLIIRHKIDHFLWILRFFSFY